MCSVENTTKTIYWMSDLNLIDFYKFVLFLYLIPVTWLKQVGTVTSMDWIIYGILKKHL